MSDGATRSVTDAGQIYQEIEAERVRQDARWGGPKYDDEHSTLEWAQILARYVGLLVSAPPSDDKEKRKRLLQIAAVAVAALESRDRLVHLKEAHGWITLLGEYQAVEVVNGPLSGQRGYVMESLIDAREGAAMPLSYYVHLDDSNMNARIPHQQLRGLEWRHGAFFEKYPQYKPEYTKKPPTDGCRTPETDG